LTAEGKVVTPPPEKSFIQKYWMYFAIAFLAIGVYYFILHFHMF
jgi:ER membrane protein complex subunit 10